MLLYGEACRNEPVDRMAGLTIDSVWTVCELTTMLVIVAVGAVLKGHRIGTLLGLVAFVTVDGLMTTLQGVVCHVMIELRSLGEL